MRLHFLYISLGPFSSVCLLCPIPMCSFLFYDYYLLEASLFAYERQKGVDLDGRDGGEELGGVKRGKTN